MEEAGRLILVIQKYIATLETHHASQEAPSTDTDMNDTHFDVDENEKGRQSKSSVMDAPGI